MNMLRHANPDEVAAWPSSLAVSRAPEIVLAEAHDAAAALKGVIDAKPKKVQFGGETYLEFEDWQTVGRFYGIAPKIIRTQYVEYGGATGWEATAEAIHVETNKVISSADSMCLTDEPHWRVRAKYEWHYVKKSGGTSADDPGKDELIWEKGQDGKSRPKRIKVQMPDEPVPLFQLRSMAQTRAAAKALRNALAWVVVLAGYKPTPAEEMDGLIESARRVNVSATGDTHSQVAGTASSAPGATAASGSGATVPGMASEQLFETPDEQNVRGDLLGLVKGLADHLRLTPQERTGFWAQHCGKGKPETVDIAALEGLFQALKTLAEERAAK